MKKVAVFFAMLGGCGIAPFLAPLLGLHLIFEGYETVSNALAPVLATIAFFLTCALLRGTKTLALKKIVASVGIVSAIGCFMVCLVLNLTVDEIWAPGFLTPVVQGVWFIGYEAMFISLAICLAGVFLLQ